MFDDLAQISSIQDDGEFTSFTVTCPSYIFKSLILSLQGLIQLTHHIERKRISDAASRKSLAARSPEEEKALKDRLELTRKTCAALYDKYISRGFTRNDAISQTNRDLKGKFYLSYEQVKQMIRQSGRFRQVRK